LATYDPKLATTYRSSAEAAMSWAERAFAKNDYAKLPHEVRDARNLAALELYRLTGSETWHKLFVDTTAFKQNGRKLAEWKSHDQADAAFLYLRLKRPVDSPLRDNVMAAFKQTTSEMIQQGRKTAFRWTKDNPDAWLGWGSLSVPQALNLVRMHFLQQDAETLSTALYASQFGVGANPLNMSMTTGVGKKFPLNPLHRDHRVSNQAAPPGITVHGPHDVQQMADSWTLKVLGNALYPPLARWPTTEFYLDIYSFEPITEFTVQTTIAPNAYIWGYLSARGTKPTGR
jgi:endoglucanase